MIYSHDQSTNIVLKRELFLHIPITFLLLLIEHKKDSKEAGRASSAIE